MDYSRLRYAWTATLHFFINAFNITRGHFSFWYAHKHLIQKELFKVLPVFISAAILFSLGTVLSIWITLPTLLLLFHIIGHSLWTLGLINGMSIPATEERFRHTADLGFTPTETVVLTPGEPEDDGRTKILWEKHPIKATLKASSQLQKQFDKALKSLSVERQEQLQEQADELSCILNSILMRNPHNCGTAESPTWVELPLYKLTIQRQDKEPFTNKPAAEINLDVLQVDQNMQQTILTFVNNVVDEAKRTQCASAAESRAAP